MSARRGADGAEPARQRAAAPRDLDELRSRRQQARRKARLARIDLGIGVLAALVVLIVSPGLAITALIAALVLIAVAVSAIVERRRASRRSRPARPRRAGRGAGDWSTGGPDPGQDPG